MDRTSVNNDNDNRNDNINDDDNDDMMSDDNLAIDDLLPIVSLKRRSPTTDPVLIDDETSNGTAVATATAAIAINSSIATIAATTTCTVPARPPRTPRSITPNLFLPILVPEEEVDDERRDDSSAEGEEKEEGEWKDTNTNNKVEEVRTEGEEGNTDNDAEDNGDEETETKTETPQKQNDSQYPAVRLFPPTNTTAVLPVPVVPALPLSLPMPLPILCTPQQHKPNAEATYDDIICHYNALIQKQRGTPQQRRRSTTTPRTPKQQQQPHSDSGSLSYSSSSNEGKGDGKKNGVSSAHSAQPLLLSPYFLFTPDVVSSQDEYVIPHDPPALVITDTVPIMNVDMDKEDDSDEEERQLCAQLFKIPSISKVLEEAEAVAVNPGYTDQGATTVGVRSSAFINNKTPQPSSVRPLRRRRSETRTSGIFRTSIVGMGGVGSNGTTAMPLLRKSSRLLTTRTKTTTRTINAPLSNRSPPNVRKQQQQQHVQ